MGRVSVVLFLAGTAFLGCNGYEKKEVRENIKMAKAGDISACIEQEGQKGSHYDVKVKFKMEIAPNGKMNRLEVVSETPNVNPTSLLECLRNKAVAWTFAPPPKGEMTLATYEALLHV